MKIKVECYSGFKADERPLHFIIGDKMLEVEKIIEQWRTPAFEYFKVLADDRKTYLLKRDLVNDGWAIE